MKLIHVHGFTELEPESLITKQYRKFARELHWNLQVQEFKWNTLEGNLTKLVANFHESDRRIKEVAVRLVETIAAEKEEVIISGHSLGGAILLEALELYPDFYNLHSVILLGAAYPQKNILSQILSITPRYYALNYHSPRWDLVLNQVYFIAKGCTAVGTNGLLNPGIFENLKVDCTHDGAAGYARLVPGIIGLLAHTQGIQSSEQAKKPWQPIAIGNTGDWDDLHHLDGHIVQRNCITGDFRIIEEGGVHQERFYSKSVIPLLDAIKELQNNHISSVGGRIIEILNSVYGMTQSHSRDFYRATPLFTLRDGSVLKTWKNFVGVEHIFIANGDGEMVFGGFVGWIHSENLRQAIAEIREEFT